MGVVVAIGGQRFICQQLPMDEWLCGRCASYVFVKPFGGEFCDNCHAQLEYTLHTSWRTAYSYYRPPIWTSAPKFDKAVCTVVSVATDLMDAGWGHFGINRAPIAIRNQTIPIGNVLPLREIEGEHLGILDKFVGAQMEVIFRNGKPMGVTKQIYTIQIESPFILTPTQVKQSLGVGFNVLSVEVTKDLAPKTITNVDSAVENMVTAGYRALARAHHPDFGGSVEIMTIINQAKRELLDLLKAVKE